MRSILAAVPLLFALSGISGSSAADQSSVSGNVRRPTLVAGSVEPLAGLVRAGADGAEWALPGGARVFASAESELRVLGVPQPLQLADRRQVKGYTVVLKSGLVRLLVPAGSESALVLSAPRKTSVIVEHGETVVSAKKQVAVANTSGAASVALAGQRFHALAAGMLQIADDARAKPRSLPVPPSELNSAHLAVSYGAAVPLAGFDWSPVAGVAGYRVELREAATRELLARVDTGEPRVPPGLAELAPGAYTLSVVSLDPTGVESARPPEHRLRVIRLSLSTGSYVDETGAVRVARGARVELSETAGVEMTYGTSNHFVPAPAALELFREESRLVRFRVAGSRDDLALTLIPRDARARVEFGPHAQRWPNSALEIRVHLEDARGVRAPAWMEARPRVTVGVEPVEVAFSRDRDGWRGVLAPRRGRGPWVVRVEVEDQHGIALGRDFIEITEPDAKRPVTDRGSWPKSAEVRAIAGR